MIKHIQKSITVPVRLQGSKIEYFFLLLEMRILSDTLTLIEGYEEILTVKRRFALVPVPVRLEGPKIESFLEVLSNIFWVGGFVNSKRMFCRALRSNATAAENGRITICC